MERRRSLNLHPASSEELDYWRRASLSLANLAEVLRSTQGTETIDRANRLMTSWPNDELAAYDFLKSHVKKLEPTLMEIRKGAEREVQMIDASLEYLDVLKGLRRASESAFAAEKQARFKRQRASSPVGKASSPVPATAHGTPAPSSGIGAPKIMLPPRASSTAPATPASTNGGLHVPFARDPKARREALANQLPLQEGRKVAFRPPGESRNSTGKAGGDGSGAPETEWILAVITKCINQDKNRYEVQDADETDMPKLYNTTLRAIIPLPDKNAPPDSAAHLNAYREFEPGQVVMALYPDTSCFYRADVIAGPRELQNAGRGTKGARMYKLRFDDDDDQERIISAEWVVEWPGQG